MRYELSCKKSVKKRVDRRVNGAKNLVSWGTIYYPLFYSSFSLMVVELNMDFFSPVGAHACPLVDPLLFLVAIMS